VRTTCLVGEKNGTEKQNQKQKGKKDEGFKGGCKAYNRGTFRSTMGGDRGRKGLERRKELQKRSGV